MQPLRFAATFLPAGYLSACSSSGDKKDRLLIEVAQYHNEATQVQAALEPRIDQIDSIRIALTKQPVANRTARIATLDSIKTAFGEWENNLVEVPGMPHDHTHEHGDHKHHHHADATLKDLPAGQMRDLQRETLNSIRQLQARFDAVAPG